MATLLSALLRDSLSENHTQEGDSPQTLSPCISSVLRLIESNPALVLETGEDRIPNIFFALHSFPVLESILAHHPSQASVVNARGDMPLHAACGVPDAPLEVVRLLLVHCPGSADHKNSDGKLPLHVAAANATISTQIIALLCSVSPSAACEIESRNLSLPLHYACAFRASIDTVSMLLKHNRDAVRLADKVGNLPVHLAILYKSSQEIIETLIGEYPDSVFVPDCKGRLALHLSAIASHPPEVVEMLISKHPEACDIYAPDGGRPPKKPIHFAIRQLGNVHMISLLLDASLKQGASMSVCGDTLLHNAIESSAPIEVVRAILKVHPAAAEETNEDGKLPLHFAAWHQAPMPIIKLLLEVFPNAARIPDKKGLNLPLHFAIQYAPQGPQADVAPALALLEFFPAAVFEQNGKGFYPIHLASRSRCPLRLIDALLKYCPYSVGFADKDPKGGLVPVDYALRMNASADVISRLLGIPVGASASEPLHIESSVETSMAPEVGLKDALLDLQSRFAEQGEEMRKLRRRMDSQTKEFQARIAEVRGLQHDVSWRDDKIRILERELDSLRKEQR